MHTFSHYFSLGFQKGNFFYFLFRMCLLLYYSTDDYLSKKNFMSISFSYVVYCRLRFATDIPLQSPTYVCCIHSCFYNILPPIANIGISLSSTANYRCRITEYFLFSFLAFTPLEDFRKFVFF